jgi:hypothetical protein
VRYEAKRDVVNAERRTEYWRRKEEYRVAFRKYSDEFKKVRAL